MATITRRDGQQFVVQAYREAIAHVKHARVIKDIRQLADQHGQFVRVFHKDNHQYEAAFAAEPGYLLGETVRHYFGFVRELIYCEYLPESRQVILVVIRGGNVFIDTKVSLQQFASELVPALTGEQRYTVHVYGDVPLSTQQQEGMVYFPEQFVDSFETHAESLFGRLPTLPNFQLLPLPYALKSAFNNSQRPWLLMALAAVLVIAFAWWVLLPSSTRVPAQMVQRQLHPYGDFDRALETPAVSSELRHLSSVIDTLYMAPGWDVVSIRYRPPGYVVLLSTDGGDLQMLQHFADLQHYQLNFTDSGAELSFQDHLKKRVKPKKIYAMAPTVETLTDNIDTILGEHSVSVGSRVRHGRAVEMRINIELKQVSPQVIQLLAKQVQGMPVALSEVDIKMDHGLLTGSIVLAVWGA